MHGEIIPNDFDKAVLKVCILSVKKRLDAYIKEVYDNIENSPLSGLKDDTIKCYFESALIDSVGFTVHSRLGLDTKYVEQNGFLDTLFDFKTKKLRAGSIKNIMVTDI